MAINLKQSNNRIENDVPSQRLPFSDSVLAIHPQLVPFILCFVLSIFASFDVFAEKINKEKWYEIEIIVFSSDMALNFDAEIWQDKPGYPDIRNNVEHFTATEFVLADDRDLETEYMLQPAFDPENKNTLEKYARRIETSSKYQLLIHRTWRQTLKSRKVYLTDKPNTDPIDENKFIVSEFIDNAADDSNISLNSSDNGNDTAINGITEQKSDEELLLQALLEEEKDFSQPLTQLPFFISEHDQIQPFDETREIPLTRHTPLSYEGPPQHLIFGNFKFSKGRYLHMNLDFLYRGEPFIPEVTEPSVETQFPMNAKIDLLNESQIELASFEELSGFIPNEKPPLVGFRINKSKRVRLNRMYYIDHPLFGIIVRIIRYVPPPPEDVPLESK